MTELTIRQATIEDAATLLAIYAPYVEKTPITFEDTVPSAEEFASRISRISANYPYLLAETMEGEVLGYAYAGAYNGRVAYNWTVETTVYVKENCRVKGTGTQLYLALEECLKAQNIYQLLACITANNQRSVRFHQKFGYEEIGIFSKIGFKLDEWWDVLWMQKTLEPLPEKPLPIIAFSSLDN